MKIRLIYTGELKASQLPHPANGGQKHVAHKHEIRKQFHAQLKRFWETNAFLSTHKVHPQFYGADKSAATYGAIWAPDQNDQVPLSKAVAHMHRLNGYSFVPLVRKDWHLVCSLRILLLRQDGVNSSINAGDVDNRIKTIIDALTKPSNLAQLKDNETPATGEDPFYCLLENDNLVTALEVETDRLLTPVDENLRTEMRQAHVVVSAEIRPTDYVTMFNLAFAG